MDATSRMKCIVCGHIYDPKERWWRGVSRDTIRWNIKWMELSCLCCREGQVQWTEVKPPEGFCPAYPEREK